MTVQPANAVILFAHGSRAAAANDSHRATCAALAERTGRRVEPAFLELDEPDLPTAVDALVEGGVTVIDVIPYLLAPGRHAREDLPRLVDQARASHPNASITLRGIFGEDPRIIDLLAAQLDDA